MIIFNVPFAIKKYMILLVKKELKIVRVRWKKK